MAVSVHGFNILAHVGAGVAGLAVGAVALLARKGGPTHRGYGRIFVAIAGLVLATAVAADVLLSPPAWLYPATLSMAYPYFGSLRALALKDQAPRALDAAAALVTLAISAALYASLAGRPSGVPLVAPLGWVALIAIYDLSRPLYASIWAARLRPLDHGLKMTSVFFAMASAGAGNLFRGFQPWSQVGPSFVGIVVMLVLAGSGRGRSGATP